MAKYPILKSFLLDGDAECYQGVQLELQAAASSGAVLQIYENGHLKTEIDLLPYSKTKTALHKLFRRHGLRPQDKAGRQKALQNAQWRKQQTAELQRLRKIYYQQQQRHVSNFRKDVIRNYGNEVRNSPNTRAHRIQHAMGQCPSHLRNTSPRYDWLAINYDKLHSTELHYIKTGERIRRRPTQYPTAHEEVSQKLQAIQQQLLHRKRIVQQWATTTTTTSNDNDKGEYTLPKDGDLSMSNETTPTRRRRHQQRQGHSKPTTNDKEDTISSSSSSSSRRRRRRTKPKHDNHKKNDPTNPDSEDLRKPPAHQPRKIPISEIQQLLPKLEPGW